VLDRPTASWTSDTPGSWQRAGQETKLGPHARQDITCRRTADRAETLTDSKTRPQRDSGALDPMTNGQLHYRQRRKPDVPPLGSSAPAGTKNRHCGASQSQHRPAALLELARRFVDARVIRRDGTQPDAGVGVKGTSVPSALARALVQISATSDSHLLMDSPQLSGAAPPNRASRATIAFQESDRPGAPRAGDACGDQAIARHDDPGLSVCHSVRGTTGSAAAPTIARRRGRRPHTSIGGTCWIAVRERFVKPPVECQLARRRIEQVRRHVARTRTRSRRGRPLAPQAAQPSYRARAGQ
jgi:hypothetical protein